MLPRFDILTLFNALTPKDGGIRRVAQAVAFGPGPRQAYDVYAPKRHDKPLPLLVFFYGGAWNSGTRSNYAWMGHALASMGYVVVIPDYRVFPDVYPVFVEDHAEAVRHAVARAADYGADPLRLGLIGQSSGAYGAVMLCLDPHYLGTDDPVAACVGLSGPYDFYPFDVPASRSAFGHWPRPEETQPVAYARKTRTHFLFLQSRADTVVGVHNSVNLAARLEAVGTDARVKLYDRLSHEDTAAVFSVPFRRKATMFEDTRTFLAETL